MKTFISDIIPRIQKYSQKLDNITLLTNQHWVVIDDINNAKTVYIFRPNNELLISKNGKVEKVKWEYLGNNLLLIDRKDESYLFKHGFFDENILALKIDGKDEYAFLVNETKFDRELNSLENILSFLSKKYIESDVKQILRDPKDLMIKNTQIKQIVTPTYTKEPLGIVKTFFGGKQNRFMIEFTDGYTGEIFKSINSNKFRINCNDTHVYYSTMESAIDALYHFITNGGILDNERIYL